jgi:hypothetical protein
MAPKTRGTKRGAASQVSGEAKRQETALGNPHLEAVEDGINRATDLPEACRKMLLATLPTCFSQASSSDVQAAFVRMASEALRSVEANLQEALKVEDAKVATIHASKEKLDGQAADADAALSEAKKTVEIKQAAVKAASEASLAADATLSTALAAQRAGEEELGQAASFKETLCTAIDVHLAAVLTAEEEEKGGCVHYKALLPIIRELDVDSTLSAALPAACMKSVKERGEFDMMVINQFGKTLAEKKENLEKMLSDGSDATKARAAAVEAATAGVESAQATVMLATRELEETQGLEATASSAAKGAHVEVERFEPECRTAAEGREAAVSGLRQFQQHNLQAFKALQDETSKSGATQVDDEPKVAAVPEATAESVKVGGA